MANLPYTLKVTSKTINPDASVTLTWQITDSTSAVLQTQTITYPRGMGAMKVINDLTQMMAGRLNADISAADIPVNSAIQYGFPAAVRPIDLL
jgi:hypothetical protein